MCNDWVKNDVEELCNNVVQTKADPEKQGKCGELRSVPGNCK